LKVIKNFLEEEEFIKLQGIFMSAHCPYYFQTSVADYGDKDYMFTHTLFDKYNPNSELYKYTEILLKKLNVFALKRMRVVCYPRTEKLIKHKTHVDYKEKHKGAVFFLNTCNGGLHIGDKFIKSEENTVVKFDSSIPHSSTNCTDEKARFILNTNYM
tara:strand:- start:85 stop:555 length:471 start_codon:yes stop_codon:yes gene_type:complete